MTVLLLWINAMPISLSPHFEAAPYFYERAEMKAQTGKYREAVVDYDEFYDAIGGRVTAAFYLQREQAG